MPADYFVHPNGLCESTKVGAGTRVWAFAHVLPRAAIGRDCNICDHVFIENDVLVGDRVTIKSGVQLWDGLRIEDDVFIGPNTTFSNDKFPRSKRYPERFLETRIEKGASIGAGAVVLPGITIGRGSMVGAGAVVTRSVPANAIVVGNPATIVGYVEVLSAKPVEAKTVASKGEGVTPTAVRGVTLHHLRTVADMRGTLSVGEFEHEIPFRPLRYFFVYGVPTVETRGEHAHLKCHQFLTAVRGSCHVVADDGEKRYEVVLDRPSVGLYLPPMIWGVQYKYSADAILLVFASDHYDANDYVRDYDRFIELVRTRDQGRQR